MMAISYLGWLREHVGHQKLISTGAVAVIRDEHGRVLLQKRRDFGVWGLPGGGQELGERIDDTVRRKTREEVGLEVEPKRIIGIYTSPRLDRLFPNGDQVQPYLASFECEIVGGAQKIEEAEVLAIDWFDFDDLPAMTSLTERILCDARNFRGEAFFEIEHCVIASTFAPLSVSSAKQSPTRDSETPALRAVQVLLRHKNRSSQ